MSSAFMKFVSEEIQHKMKSIRNEILLDVNNSDDKRKNVAKKGNERICVFYEFRDKNIGICIVPFFAVLIPLQCTFSHSFIHTILLIDIFISSETFVQINDSNWIRIQPTLSSVFSI